MFNTILFKNLRICHKTFHVKNEDSIGSHLVWLALVEVQRGIETTSEAFGKYLMVNRLLINLYSPLQEGVEYRYSINTKVKIHNYYNIEQN